MATRGRVMAIRGLALTWVWVGLFGLCGQARAESARRIIRFSALSERTESGTPMNFGQEVYRVSILNQLRSSGLGDVGGEDTASTRDESERSELVLNGTVTEYECQRLEGTINCRVGVRWQVHDPRSNQAVYETTTRDAVYGTRPQATVVSVGQQLLSKALRSLLQRPRFIALLASEATPTEPVGDEPDAIPSLNPQGDERRAEATRRARAVAAAAAEAKRRTEAYDLQQRRVATDEHADGARRIPAYVPAMKWGGGALGALGLIVTVVSQVSYDRDTTSRKDFETLRLWNDLGWVSMALGGSSFAASLLLAPRLPSAQPADGRAGARLSSPLLLSVRGRY